MRQLHFVMRRFPGWWGQRIRFCLLREIHSLICPCKSFMALSFSIRAVDDTVGQGSVVLATIELKCFTGEPPEVASGLRPCSAGRPDRSACETIYTNHQR